jgi:uncharacterized protein YuzE
VKIVSTYSAEADTAYLAFGDAREVTETVAPLDDIAIDFDANGRIVGIELVTASRYFDPTVFDEDPYFEELIGVTEIAEYLGKHKQNVAQHYTRRPDFPRPVAALPTGRYWRRGDVESWYEQSKSGRCRRRAAEELAVAAEWLTGYLSAGRRPLDDVREQAQERGLRWSAIERAARAIDVEKHDERGTTIWALPREHPALRQRG